MSNLGNKEIMAKNIKRLMDKYGKSRREVSTDIGVSYTTFNDWINGKTYPRIDKIEIMAEYFNVSKSDLVEEESPKVHLIAAHADKLSDEDQEKVIEYIQLLKLKKGIK